MDPITIGLALVGLGVGFGASTVVTKRKLGSAQDAASKELKKAKKEADKQVQEAKEEANKLVIPEEPDASTDPSQVVNIQFRMPDSSKI